MTEGRRRLVMETLAIGLSVIGFGAVYGMSARAAGFSLLDLEAMNLLVFAGGSQLMAIGLLTAGLPWLTIVIMTAVVNARHFLYSTSLSPWFAGRRRIAKALAAYVVVDESFVLSTAHFRRLGRFDAGGYALVAGFLVVTWLASTALGWASLDTVPAWLGTGLLVVVPAALAGMAMSLISDRPSAVAAAVAAVSAVVLGSLVDSPVGIVLGAVLGAFVGMLAAHVPGSVRGQDAPARGRPASGPAEAAL